MPKTTSLITGLALAVAASTAISAPPSSLNLMGHDYPLVLEENTRLGERIDGHTVGRGQHYMGRIEGLNHSWVRLSKVDGRWQGLAMAEGDHYTLALPDSENGTDKAAAQYEPAIHAAAVSGLPHKACGLAHKSASSLSASSTVSVSPTMSAAHSVFHLPSKSSAEFSELCATTVDGICMLAEIEFVFDQQFQSQLDDPQGTASSMINMVEGYYQDTFGIGFDTITTEFLSSQVFTASSDPDVLLGGEGQNGEAENSQSIRALSASGQLSFEQSRPALLHVVTGRNFDDETAGIAFTDVLCNESGFAASTSQLLGLNTSPAAITAIVAAHEIGHNFGAGHDGVDNNCGGGFLMEPGLTPNTQGFSTCSASEIRNAISAITTPEQCFNFPADASIRASTNNETDVDDSAAFTAEYTLQVESGYQAPSQLLVSGLVSNGLGSFVSASLNGSACSVGSNGQTYSCTLGNPGASANLLVTSSATSDSAAFTHQLSLNGANVVETNTSNNSVEHQVTVNGATNNPPPLPDPNTQQPASQPSPQPQAQQQGESGGGSGGGASGLGALLVLSVLALRPRRRR